MTLLEYIRAVETAAMSQPSVNMIVRNDVFRLNACPDARYGVFAWTQGTHRETPDSGFIRYSLTLFYVDRLVSDKSNETEIQSTGISTLGNIIRTLADKGIETSECTYQTFNQRFMDECAGVFANVEFTVPAGTMCAEGFGDYDEDFNDDFLIF